MKYPKLWGGANPVGEALTRALQRTGAPYLSAMMPDGTIAEKTGDLTAVRGGEADRYMTYFGDREYQSVERHRSVLVTSKRAGPLLRRFRAPGGEEYDGVHPFTLQHALPRGYALVETRNSPQHPIQSQRNNWKLWLISSRGQKQLVDEYEHVAPFNLLNVPNSVTRGVHLGGALTWGLGISGNAEAYTHICYTLADGVVTKQTLLGAPEGKLHRTAPNELLWHQYSTHTNTLQCKRGNGLAEDWVDYAEPNIAALLDYSPAGSWGGAGSGSPDFITRLNSGEYLAGYRARRDFRVDSINGIVPGGFDLANTGNYTAEQLAAGLATQGVTLFKGPLGAMQPVLRFQYPGSSLEADPPAVSGDRILVVVREAHGLGWVGSTWYTNPNYRNYPTFILMSEDGGNTWTYAEMPSSGFTTGFASVDLDGSFLLPLKLAPEGGVTRWGVFRIPSVDAATWGLRLTVRSQYPDALADSLGCVVPLHASLMRSNPEPGRPWLVDDRITPPWETP